MRKGLAKQILNQRYQIECLDTKALCTASIKTVSRETNSSYFTPNTSPFDRVFYIRNQCLNYTNIACIYKKLNNCVTFYPFRFLNRILLIILKYYSPCNNTGLRLDVHRILVTTQPLY